MHHMNPHKREAEGDGGGVAEIELQAKGCQGRPTATSDQKHQGSISPQGNRASMAPLKTWFQTSGFQSYKGIDFYCFGAH